jgi:hypothetical protein
MEETMIDLSVGGWVCLGLCVGCILLAKLARSAQEDSTRDWHRDPSPAARELRRLQKAHARRAQV